MQNITVQGSSINSNSNVICSCNCTGSQSQGMDISELEFVQIAVIMVVMTVVVVVVMCLLNHYKLSALTFFSRQTNSYTQDGQQDQSNTQLDGCVWPTDCLVTEPGTPEVMDRPRSNQERFNPPSFMHQERISRFQPTFPYLQQGVDLPPTICLSDGEELPPYQGPCRLQLRDPEQQLELSRASIRAPPNRTIFHSDLMDVYNRGGASCPTSCHSGVSVARRMNGPPPTYSEVMGHYPGSSAFQNQYTNNESLDQQIKDRTVTDTDRERRSYNRSTRTTVKELKDHVSEKVKEEPKDPESQRVKPV